MTQAPALLVAASGQDVGLWASQVLTVFDNPPVQALPAAPPAVIGVIAFGGAPVPVIDLACWMGGPAASHDGPVAMMQGRGFRIACRVAAIRAFCATAPAEVTMIDVAELAIWRDMPRRKVSLAAHVQRRPAAPATADDAVLTLRLRGASVSLPAAQIRHLLEPAAAVVIEVPLPGAAARLPAPLLGSILLYEGRAVAMLDLGCRPGATTPIVLARAGGNDVAFAVEAIMGFGPNPALQAGGAMLELPTSLGDIADAPTQAEPAERADFLEVVLGGRDCLLPFAAVRRVLPQEGRQALPGLPGGSIRAVAGQVLPGRDVRRALALPDTAQLAHDIVLGAAGLAFFLPVEQVRGVCKLGAAALAGLPDTADIIDAVARPGDGRLLWVLSPQRLLDTFGARCAV